MWSEHTFAHPIFGSLSSKCRALLRPGPDLLSGFALPNSDGNAIPSSLFCCGQELLCCAQADPLKLGLLLPGPALLRPSLLCRIPSGRPCFAL